MNKLKYMFVPFVIFALMACATVPPPKRIEPRRAAIGISVKTRAPVKVFTSTADMVYFIKVDEEGGLYNQGNFIRSNYRKGGQVYLLNAKPGRYAAIGCYERQKTNMLTVFPKELIKLTEVTLGPGTIAFMGEYVVDKSMGFKDADNAQLHYLPLIAPGAKVGILSPLHAAYITGEYVYKGSLHEEHCGKQDEIEFLTHALEHFKDTNWIDVIQERMEDLKAKK